MFEATLATARARADGVKIDAPNLRRALSRWDDVWAALTLKEQARVAALLLERDAYDGANGKAALARLVGVSRARVTQVMELLHLAPDIQEEILFATGDRRGGVGHRALVRLAFEPVWLAQVQLWRRTPAPPRSVGGPRHPARVLRAASARPCRV